MSKTKKSRPNSKNYNRKQIRRFESQIVKVKGIFIRDIDPITIILKNVSINRRQTSHITLVLKEPREFYKYQRIQCKAIVKPYYRRNNTKSYELREI